MPRMCCVLGCRSNYRSTLRTEKSQTTFLFPKDPKLRSQWLRSIHRGKFNISRNTAVCCKHFDESEIIRMETVWNKTGKVQEIPLNRPKLKEGAIPHLLIGLPSKSTTQSSSMRSPKVKKGVIVKREDKVLELCLQNDIVHNFDAFLEQFNTRVKLQQWQFKITSRAVYFYILNVSCDCSEENIIDEGLKIISSISINSDLIVRIYIDNKEVSTDDLICVFGETKKLSHWWQFENIITRYGNY